MRIITLLMFSLSLASCYGGDWPHPHHQCAGRSARIGMTVAELLRACGRPSEINIDDSGGPVSMQYVYGLLDHRDYVYIENGKVDSMQY